MILIFFFLSVFYHIMGKANKVKYNIIIMSLVKFRLLVMSLTYQNSSSPALSIGSYLFCLKMSQNHKLFHLTVVTYLITKVVQTVEKKRVDLVVALRTILGEWGGIQTLCCPGVNPA